MQVDRRRGDPGEIGQPALLLGFPPGGLAEGVVDRFEVPAELSPQLRLAMMIEQHRFRTGIEHQATGREVVRAAVTAQGVRSLLCEEFGELGDERIRGRPPDLSAGSFEIDQSAAVGLVGFRVVS